MKIKQFMAPSGIILLAILSSCNEKINPDLKNGSSSLIPPTASATSDKYFKVESTAPTILNHTLHKTGAGNFNSPCEISATTFSQAQYSTNQSAFDITCFLEAEELGLYFNGTSFKVSASPNTCEYVVYSPFSFYQFQPGTSTGTYVKTECSEFDGTVVFDDSSLPGSGHAGGKPCGSYYQVGVNEDFTTEDTAQLCHFDYSKKTNIEDGPNCDTGTITLITRTYDGAATAPTNSTTTTVKCGGKVGNCVAGPMKEYTSTQNSLNGTRFYEYNFTKQDEAFSKEHTILSPFEKNYGSNRYAANFVRQCSGVDHDNDLAALPALGGFNSISKTFNPYIMDSYARNIQRDVNNALTGAANVNFSTTISLDANADVVPTGDPSEVRRVRPLATTSFLGASPIEPFYTYTCLDAAQEVKGRIRIAIRDWDRVYPVGPNIELISDTYLGDNALMDNTLGVETALPELWYEFNDILDWDDSFSILQDAHFSAGQVGVAPLCQQAERGEFDPFNFPWNSL